MPHDDHEGLSLLRELLAIAAPPGREQAMGAKITQLIQAMGYTCETDPAGNVLVRIPGKDSAAGTAVLAAHQDEIGVLVTRVEPDGSLCVANSGALLPMKIGERPLTIIGDHGQATGVLCFGSTHGDGVNQVAPQWSKMRLVTGLTVEELAKIGIRPGSTAVPLAEHRGPVLFGNDADPFVAAWTLDDRMGMIAQLRLLKVMKEENLQSHRPLIVAFTIHEEGGCHGAKVLAQRERPEIFIAVDGCGILAENGLRNDGSPVVWSHDHYGHLDQKLVVTLCDAAKAAGHKAQVNVFLKGAYSDATAVYNVGAAPRVGIIGHARENSHGYEYTPLSSFNNLLDTLVQLIKAKL